MMTIRHFPGFLILLYARCLLLHAQPFQTLMFDFTRTVTRTGNEERSGGTIYWDSTRTIVQIRDPLNQWMYLTDTSTILFYPDENRVLQIKSTSPAALPFLNLFTGAVKETFGLPEMGYTIQRNEMRGDTLFTYWDPDEYDRKTKGIVIIALLNDKIVSSESWDPGGKRLIKTVFRNHFTYKSVPFPMEMTLENYAGNESFTEIVHFFNPVFDKSTPGEILEFTIPDSATEEVLEW